MHEQNREGVVLFFHLGIGNLIQSCSVQHGKQHFHNLKRRLAGKVDILLDIMVERVRLQQEGAVQDHRIDILRHKSRLECSSSTHREAPDDDFAGSPVLSEFYGTEQLLGFFFTAGCDVLAGLGSKTVVEHDNIEIQAVRIVCQVIHRNPGLFAVGPVPMAEDDSLGGAFGRNVPALHRTAAIQCREGHILILQPFGDHRCGIERGYRRIGQYPGDIGMECNEAEDKKEKYRQ